MNWLKDHWFKIGILVCILLISFFAYRLANSYLQQNRALATQAAAEQKEEKDRAFAASQKDSCLSIYKQEASKWNNVDGWRYDEEKNKCYIQYKDLPKKTEVQCDADYKDNDDKIIPVLLRDYLLCTEGLFEKSF